ncbi:MAG: selenocysteine-specific translation elongation factor [Spirochaetales bacterium]|nr:selenocysteine-specific translation elongation factor [Spirochaetales bacterium]
MMHVVGTSGHVDHGKTALIKALTGIDTDRLPEEKTRGLTIDLGFAHFEGPDGSVGVIDVPGHERFIRNMVAGAWSLSCALLVVAADDGWMQQSADHLKVLHALGVNSIIGVINKIDKVPESRLKEVEEDAALHILEITGSAVPIRAVSALDGSGIEELKQLILDTLSTLPAKPTGDGYLYIDRVFSIQGSGVVVTGSLAEGPLKSGDFCTLLPAGKKVKIRGLQSYHAGVDTAFPVSRLACNLQNLTKEEVYRGCCLAMEPKNFFVSRDFLVALPHLEALFTSGALKNHGECEVSGATFHSRCSVHFRKNDGLVRIKTVESLAVRWKEPFVLIRQGGSRILAGGCFLWTWSGAKPERFAAALKKLNTFPEGRHPDAFRLLLQGYLPRTDRKEDFSFLKDEVEEAGEFLFLSSWSTELRKVIAAAASQPGGVSLKELESRLQLDKGLLEELTSPLLKQNKLASRGQILFQNLETGLSPFSKNLLERIRQGGTEGFDPSKELIQGAQKELRNLTRAGLTVALENGIFYSPEVYRELVHAILAGRKSGDTFSIPQVKERTGLSRKFSIPVLNRMEQDGYVKRSDDLRVVLRLPQDDAASSSIGTGQ